MDRLFLYLGICIWIWASKNSATWRVSGYIPMHCVHLKTRSWEHHDGTCDKCGLQALRDKKHALFLCPCMQMCSLRLQFADSFHDLPLAHKITVNQTGAFYFSQACSEDVFNFSQKQTYDSYRSISELMDVFCMAGAHQQPEQSDFQAEGQI